MSGESEKGRYQYEFNTETHAIVCSRCDAAPSLVALDKNDGTEVSCECDGVRYSMDSVPYELTVHDIPDEWEVLES